MLAKYVDGYDRGILASTECANGLLDLMGQAPDDATALALCETLPIWLSDAFRQLLNDYQTTDFYRRSFGIGDTRTNNQIHDDALRQQETLHRLSSAIRNMLQ